MKKVTMSIFMVVLFMLPSVSIFAQECEGFDDLTVSGYVAEQLGGNWTTWSNNPGSAEDGIVSDMYSTSPSNSVLVEGTTDLVHLITGENITAGVWSYSLNIYVPTGTTGYWNLQKDVVPGAEWGFQVMFEDDMTMVVDGGAAGAAIIPYAYDTWYNCEVIVDLDLDWCEFYVDGNLELEYQWTLGTFGTAGANTLAGSNIYANAGATGTLPGAYFDDICFELLGDDEMCEDFDALTVGGYVAEQLGGNWTTWSNNPGSAEDGIVSDMYSTSPSNSVLVEGTTDLVHLITGENITEGAWSYGLNIYVPTGTTGYWNLQKDVVPGAEWGFQVMFEDDMTMIVDGGAAGAAIIPYEYDTWYNCEVIVDLDADWCMFYVDGNLELEYQWTLGTFGTAGANTLAGSNIYANAGATGTLPGAYFDDVCFEQLGDDENCENFDELIVGGYVAEQLGDPWTTWSGTPGTAEDAMVSDMYAFSPGNSFVVDAGTIDLILELNDEPITEWQWVYSHMTYIPAGFSGYFNMQSEPTAGVEWVVEVFFNDDGTGNVTENTIIHDFTYMQDEWILVEINIDLDSGLGQVWFDQELFVQWEVTTSIGGIDYFGWDVGGAPGAYYDDVCFDEGWEVVPTAIDETTNNADALNIYPNPANDFVNISSDVELRSVRILNYAGQLVYNSLATGTQFMVNTSELAAGVYVLQLETETGISSRKLIIE